MSLQKENLNLLHLGLQLIVAHAATECCLVPWIEVELGVCSSKVRLRQYWPCLVDTRSSVGSIGTFQAESTWFETKARLTNPSGGSMAYDPS